MHTSKPREMIIGGTITLNAQKDATKNGDVLERLSSLCKDICIDMIKELHIVTREQCPSRQIYSTSTTA